MSLFISRSVGGSSTYVNMLGVGRGRLGEREGLIAIVGVSLDSVVGTVVSSSPVF